MKTCEHFLPVPRPRHDLPLRHARRGVLEEEAEEEQNHLLSAAGELLTAGRTLAGRCRAYVRFEHFRWTFFKGVC